jgi:hypothetical protein
MIRLSVSPMPTPYAVRIARSLCVHIPGQRRRRCRAVPDRVVECEWMIRCVGRLERDPWGVGLQRERHRESADDFNLDNVSYGPAISSHVVLGACHAVQQPTWPHSDTSQHSRKGPTIS